MIEFGLETFGDITLDAEGNLKSHAQTLRDVVAEAVRADELGVDTFGVGEHHRDDFAISATDTLLAAIAGQTKNIRLGSAVTVLSSDDPIRVFQRFSTLDAVSNGRAEVIVGRGSFTESFPLFGFNLGDYEALFEEKLEIFAQLAHSGEATWSGSIRPPLQAQKVYPEMENGRSLRFAIGVGGSPQSVVRAAKYGAPLVLAIIGGDPARFAPYAELYRNSLNQLGKAQQPIAIHSPGHISDTDEQAREEMWPGYQSSFGRIGRERGWGPLTRDHFEGEASFGSIYAGSPETVAARIARALSVLGASRFDLKYSTGTLSHDKLMRSIELYATEVIPRVRHTLAKAA